MQRITVEEVKAAYAATGLKPLRNSYRTTTGGVTTCGCPAVAVAVYRDPGFREHLLQCGIDERLDAVFGEDYMYGFVNAVDNGEVPGVNRSDEGDMGRTDGIAVLDAWPEILESTHSH